MAAPPSLEGADHDADQFKLEPLSKEVALSELTVPGTVLATAVHLAYIVILDGGVKDPPDATGPYVKSPDGVL